MFRLMPLHVREKLILIGNQCYLWGVHSTFGFSGTQFTIQLLLHCLRRMIPSGVAYIVRSNWQPFVRPPEPASAIISFDLRSILPIETKNVDLLDGLACSRVCRNPRR